MLTPRLRKKRTELLLKKTILCSIFGDSFIAIGYTAAQALKVQNFYRDIQG